MSSMSESSAKSRRETAKALRRALLAAAGLPGGNSGGSAVLIPRTVTANGTYDPADDSADGYSAVTVDVPVGETVYRAPNSGRAYTKNEIVNANEGGGITAYWVNLSALNQAAYANASDLETYELHIPTSTLLGIDNSKQDAFRGCTALKRVLLDCRISSINGSNLFTGCTALETIQIGAVGKPWTGAASRNDHFTTCTALTDIIIYVDASTLADVPENIRNNAPFGAANAAVTYKNSTTGEVITA